MSILLVTAKQNSFYLVTNCNNLHDQLAAGFFQMNHPLRDFFIHTLVPLTSGTAAAATS
jgi:hypothetical protein